MSQDIMNEVTFFLHSLAMGVVITAAYDGFLVFRRLVRHTAFLVSLEDIVFWIACAIGVFYMLYEENNGILRWFAVFAASIGMLVYKKTVSPLIVGIISAAIQKLFRIIFKILRIFLKPIVRVIKKINGVFRIFGKKTGKAGKFLKNKLTGCLKLLKITLCKH